jgi:hypothetical protein
MLFLVEASTIFKVYLNPLVLIFFFVNTSANK